MVIFDCSAGQRESELAQCEFLTNYNIVIKLN